MSAQYPHVIEIRPAQLAAQLALPLDQRNGKAVLIHRDSTLSWAAGMTVTTGDKAVLTHRDSPQRISPTPDRMLVEANDSMVTMVEVWAQEGADPSRAPAWLDPNVRVPAVPANGHYRFSGNSTVHEPSGQRVWEIEAARDFDVFPHGTISEGEKGGWIKDRWSLEAVENADASLAPLVYPWVYPSSTVLGRVRDAATVRAGSFVDAQSDVGNFASLTKSNLIRSRAIGHSIIRSSDVSDSVVEEQGFVIDSHVRNGFVSYQVLGSALDFATVKGGRVTDSRLLDTTVQGDARVTNDNLKNSVVGFGYRTPPTEDGAMRPVTTDVHDCNQKYDIDRSETIEVTTADGVTVKLGRITAIRDIPATATAPAIPKGTVGGFVTGHHALSHAGRAWVEKGAVVLDGMGYSHVGDDAVIEGNSRIEGGSVTGAARVKDSTAVNSNISGSATVDASTLTDCRVQDGAQVSLSDLWNTSVEGGSVIDSSALHRSRVRASEIRSSDVRPAGRRDHPSEIDVQNSTVIDSRINGDAAFGTHVIDSDLRQVTLDRVDARGVSVIPNLAEGERLTLDTKLTPRAAEVYTAMMDSPAAPAAASETIMLPLDPDTDADTLRYVLIAALQAKEPQITRYLDTLAVYDQDYGVIETIVSDPALRAGMIDALQGVEGVVVEGKFLPLNGPADTVREELDTLKRNLYEVKLGQMNEGLWANVRVPVPLSTLPSEELLIREHLYAAVGPDSRTKTATITVGSENVPVVPILLERHELRFDQPQGHHPSAVDGKPAIRPDAQGARSYEAAFVDARTIQFGVANMRFLTVASPSNGMANGLAFNTPEDAATYLDTLLAQEGGVVNRHRDPRRRDHWTGNRVSTEDAPILTGATFADDRDTALAALKRIELSADFGAPLPKASLMFTAAVPNDPARVGTEDPVQLGLVAHTGHQAAIIRPVLGTGPHDHAAVLDTKALDGAVATPAVALHVAARRDERDRDWTSENRPVSISAKTEKQAGPRPGISFERG